MRFLLKRHADQSASRKFNRWFVQVIAGCENHHIIAGMDECLDGGEDEGRSTGPYGHFSFGVVANAASLFGILRDPFSEACIARHGSVLVAPFCHCCDNRLLEGLRWLKIGKPLAHVQGSVGLRHRTHLCENGGAHPGQFGR